MQASERKKANRPSLERQYSFLQSALDGVADPIIVVGTDFHVKLMNRAAMDYSLGGEQDIGNTRCHQVIFGLNEPCNSVGRPCPLLEVLESDRQVMVEHEYTLPDGEKRTYEILASPLRDEEGELVGIVESLRDVSERKKAADLLRSDQERLETRVRARTAELLEAKERAEMLYKVSPSAIFTVDEKGLVTSWNDKAEEITGYSAAEMMGGHPLPFVDEKKKPRACLVSKDNQQPVSGKECRVKTRDGRMRIVRINADLLRDANDKVFGGIGSFEDITEQKRVENMLRTERDKFRGMLSAMGQGMHILNPDFAIEYQNDVLREHFGDKIGQKCYQVYKQRDKPCEVCRMHAAIETGAIQRTEELMANGRFYEQSYAPFTDVDGRVKALILLRDITEEKALQAETMRAGQLASIGELAAGVAHEINNPINGIINYAQVLLDEAEGREEMSGVLARIIKEGERIADIVRNLLSFARQRENDLEEIALADVIDDSLALLKHQFQKDGIRIEVEVPLDLPPVFINPQQLQQVFLNLLSNARHALNQRYPGRDDRKRLEIKSSLAEVGGIDYVRTAVTDYGVGIPPEIIGNIFDPFFSSKKPGEGTGLGLSISHGLVRDFHGLLHVESEPGHFTMMIVDLPVNQPESATTNTRKGEQHD